MQDAAAGDAAEAPVIIPQKDVPVKPVVLAIAAFLASAMGIAYLLSGGTKDQPPNPPIVAIAPPPAPAVSQAAAPPPPPAAPAPVATPAPPPVPAPVSEPVPAPIPVPVPAPPAPVQTAAAPAPVQTPAPAPKPAPAGPRCGNIVNPGSLFELPIGTPSADAVCVAKIWIKIGRSDDAVGVLSVQPHADYPPAMLELGKLYDPKSNYANPPASADFARDVYRKVIQRTDEEAIRKEAQQRLDALGKR